MANPPIVDRSFSATPRCFSIGVGEQGDELLAPAPADEVAGADGGRERVTHGREQVFDSRTGTAANRPQLVVTYG